MISVSGELNPFKAITASYERLAPDDLTRAIRGVEAEVSASQMRLAAARKAQKNQKRAAKKDGRIAPEST